MSATVSTGNADLDSALAMGGLPRAAITAVHGLATFDLRAFLLRLVEGTDPGTGHMSTIRAIEPHERSWELMEGVLNQGFGLLVLLAEDPESESWLRDADTARRLRVLATEYEAAVVVGIPMKIHMNASLRPRGIGLAQEASIRLELAYAGDGSERLEVCVVKNRDAEPFGQAYVPGVAQR